MLRSSILLVAAALLLTSSLWLTWGEKTVVYEDCRLDRDRSARVCSVAFVEASYDPYAMRGVTTVRTMVGSMEDDVERRPFWHAYDEPAAAGASWWHSPLLAAAPPLLVAGAVSAPLAVAASWTLGRREAWVRRASWAPVASAALVSAGVLASLGGVLLHAATWQATRVHPLVLVPGSWVLLAGGLLGLFGGVRLHQELAARAEGRTGGSPLVPADELYGFRSQPEPEPDEARRRVAWRWPAGGGLALASVVLLLLPLGVPLAAKDITLRDCTEESMWGSVCTYSTLSVTYRMAHATVFEVQESASVTELLSVGGPHYYGDFQEAHGGPAWMGLGAVVLLLGALAMLAWLGLAAAGADHERLRLAASALLAGGFVLAVAGVAWQAATWLGVPAGRSVPGIGAWSGLLGLALLVRWWWVRLRAPSPATATPTSPSD